MKKTEGMLRQGRARLDGLRARTGTAGSEPRVVRIEGRWKIQELESRYAEVSRRFLQLQAAGGHGVADLKVGLEKAWDAFQSQLGGLR